MIPGQFLFNSLCPYAISPFIKILSNIIIFIQFVYFLALIGASIPRYFAWILRKAGKWIAKTH